MLSRRDVLKLALLASLVRPGVALAAPSRAPRRWLTVLLSGGIDAIYGADPKTRADVEPWVDVPYAASDIVERDGVPLGPHFAPLAAFASRLAIVKGIQVRTANHNTGTEQFLRMKTRTRPEMPTLLSLIGDRKEREAVGCMSWTFGTPQFTRLFQDTAPEDLLRMAHALRRNGHAVGMREAGPTAKSLEESATLLERMAKLPPWKPEVWSPDEGPQHTAAQLQRVLWVFEHDLARAYELNIGSIDQPWDTHTFNTERQTESAKSIAMLARFFVELDKRSAADGPLSESTRIVIGSELGRYPAINRQDGKDHFPEVSFVFSGPGVVPGVYGRTGRRMEALPVSLRTGKDGADTIELDDIGASLLRAAGVADPAVYGYGGRVLPFLAGT